MSDSDEDSEPNNFPVFTHEKSLIPTQTNRVNQTYGPYNMQSANFNKPNPSSGFDQRMYSMRETSPLSIQSFPHSRTQYSQPYSQSAMSSRGTVYNARCRSPMSIRSIGSNATVSAVEIASVLKNVKFNKYEFQLIREAYRSQEKDHRRRRVGKRRNLKAFIKQCRRKSGGESGVDGSNSSQSSDDGRSTRSAFCAGNVPRIKVSRGQTTRMDLNKLTTQVRENDVYKDCTQNFKQNSFRNLLSVHSRTVGHSYLNNHEKLNYTHDNRFAEPLETHRDRFGVSENASVTLKDRLTKQPSVNLLFERFNKTSVNPTYEISYTEKSKPIQQKESNNNNRYNDIDDEDEIFPHSTNNNSLTQQNTLNRKRVVETENTTYPAKKRTKLLTTPSKFKKVVTNNNDFNFKKPQLPIRKFSTFMKHSESEKLLAKSSQPLVGNVVPDSNQQTENPQEVTNLEDKDTNTIIHKKDQNSQNNNNTMNSNADLANNTIDVSMKPSFIKRKLFTQTVDIGDSKTISADHMESPQQKVLRSCRLKNKVRKLTSQPCLNREVSSDINYLDLIHKIVPPDQIRIQNLNNTNKKEANKSSLDKKGKWDVSLAVSMCHDDAKSDTFTDEEIFKLPEENNKITQITKKSAQSTKKHASPRKQAFATKCRVLLQQLPGPSTDIYSKVKDKQCVTKKTILSGIKSFWDTDFESDMEDHANSSSHITFQKEQISNEAKKDSKFITNGEHFIGTKKKPRGTALSVNSCQNQSNSVGNQSVKVNEIICDNEDQHIDNDNNNRTQLRRRRSRSQNNANNTLLSNKSVTNEFKNKPTNKCSSNKERKNFKTLDNVQENKENNNALKSRNRSRSQNTNNVKNKNADKSSKSNTNQFRNKLIDTKLINATGSDRENPIANLLDNVQDNKKDNRDNVINRRSRSQNKNANVINIYSDAKKTTTRINNTKTINKSSSNKPERKTSFSAKNKKQSQSIFNISRESLRCNSSQTDINSPSNALNTSRESLRLKQKREAKLNNKGNVP